VIADSIAGGNCFGVLSVPVLTSPFATSGARALSHDSDHARVDAAIIAFACDPADRLTVASADS